MRSSPRAASHWFQQSVAEDAQPMWRSSVLQHQPWSTWSVVFVGASAADEATSSSHSSSGYSRRRQSDLRGCVGRRATRARRSLGGARAEANLATLSRTRLGRWDSSTWHRGSSSEALEHHRPSRPPPIRTCRRRARRTRPRNGRGTPGAPGRSSRRRSRRPRSRTWRRSPSRRRRGPRRRGRRRGDSCSRETS